MQETYNRILLFELLCIHLKQKIPHYHYVLREERYFHRIQVYI